jgi:hypothetical protein
MMRNRRAPTVALATAVATCALFWLVVTLNRHGDELTLALRYALVEPRVSVSAEPKGTFDGLELVDMYECMCASNEDISQWVGWWLIAATFGGLPTAVLTARSREHEAPTA